MNNTYPLISVIVPIYKVEKYLNECIDSILNQTYKNLEIILVDDGSPDSCGNICDDYALKDKRIKVIHKENGGLSDARNAGLDIATGEYISFVDSDDIIHPQFVEKLLSSITDNMADISFCKRLIFEKEVTCQPIIKNKYSIFSSNELIDILYDKYWKYIVVVWNKLYHKDIFKNLRFAKGMIYEDAHIFTDIYFNTNLKIAYTDNVLYFFRRNLNSLSRGIYTKKHYESWKAFCYKRLNLFKGNKNLYDNTMRELSKCIFSTYMRGLTKEAKQDLNFKIIYYILLNKEIHWKSKILFFIKLTKNTLLFK